MVKGKEYITHESNPDEAHMMVQKRITSVERKVDTCNSSVIEDIQSLQADMSYYLYNRMFTQPEYFEYMSQISPSIRKFKKECVCRNR